MKHLLIATALLITPALTTPVWAEEDLPMPVQWGGTGRAAPAESDAPASVTFGDGAHGKRQPTGQRAASYGEPAEDSEKTIDANAAPSKVEVRSWDVKKKEAVKP